MAAAAGSVVEAKAGEVGSEVADWEAAEGWEAAVGWAAAVMEEEEKEEAAG